MAECAIRVRDLHKRYPGRNGPVHAVNGIDLEINPGECFGLLGPNGAGKTTTVEIVEGLNQPSSGEVEVLGMNWTADAVGIRETDRRHASGNAASRQGDRSRDRRIVPEFLSNGGRPARRDRTGVARGQG